KASDEEKQPLAFCFSHRRATTMQVKMSRRKDACGGRHELSTEMPTKRPRKHILMPSFMSFIDNDLTTAAAAVSYFSMLTLFPTLLLLLTIGNRLLGPETVEKYIIGQALAFLPGAQTFVRKNLESLTNVSTSVIISCITVMLWAAS